MPNDHIEKPVGAQIESPSLNDKIKTAWTSQAFQRGLLPAVAYFALGIVVSDYQFNSERFKSEFFILGILLSLSSVVRAIISFLGIKDKIDKNRFLLPLRLSILLNGVFWAMIFGLVAYESGLNTLQSIICFTILIGVCSSGPTSMIALPIIQPLFLALITLVPSAVYIFRYIVESQAKDHIIFPLILVIYYFYTVAHGRKLRIMLKESFKNHFELEKEKENLHQTLTELISTQTALLVEKEKTYELVSTVQSFFLPDKESFASKSLSLCGFYASATEASGDWWWYGPYSNDGLFLLLGDVTGHGAASAMLTASTASQLHLLKRLTPDIRADQILKVLNQEFSAIAKGKYMMTMSALEIDSQMKVRWWNAASPPVLILRQSGEIEEIILPSHPLGVADFELSHLDFELKAGDRMILYTDGLSELELPNGSQIRFRALKEIFLKTLGLPTNEAMKFITDSVSHLRNGHPLKDDITVVLIDCKTHPNH